MYLNYGENGLYIRNNSSTQVMFINNSGNVGIGTTDPQRQLHIKASAADSCLLRIESAANKEANLEFYDTATRWQIYKPASSTALRFWDGTDNRVTFLKGVYGG